MIREKYKELENDMEILLDNKLSTAMENFGLKIEHIERKCIIIEYDRYTTRRDINLLQHRLDDSTKNIEARQPIINKARFAYRHPHNLIAEVIFTCYSFASFIF